jgi:uncharacterized protein (DUF952 family)
MHLAEGWEEAFLQAVIEWQEGDRPALLQVDLEHQRPFIEEEMLRQRQGRPLAFSWSALVDTHRDFVGVLDRRELGADAEMMELARRLSGERYRQMVETLRRFRPHPPQGLLFHMVEMERWMDRRGSDYRAPSLEEEGFIHATREPEVLEEVAEALFPSRSGSLALLVVDLARVEAEVRWEPGRRPGGQQHLFPHIYGPLNLSAVLDVRHMSRDAEGRWRFPWA